MKKRVLSMLLAFILCFSTLPMTAFAQETDAVAEQEEQQGADSAEEQEKQQEADSAEQQGADSAEGQEKQQEAAPVTEQKEAEAAAAPGEETSSDKSTTAGEAPDTVNPSAESVSDSDAGTQDAGADDEKKAAVQKVQALINALPETVTVENAESVSAQLEAIDEAMAELTKEQIAELDMTRLHAISEAMNAPMTVPMTVAEGQHADHPICGARCTDENGHSNVTWTATSTLNSDMDAGNYYLTADVTLDDTWRPKSGTALDLNGYSITVDADVDAITVSNGYSFTLTDCNSRGGVHYFTENTEKYNLWEPVKTGGDIRVTGGVITHSSGKNGSGIFMEGNGTFTMYGGTICGNYNSTEVGAGVRATKSKISMSGGAISGNVTGSPDRNKNGGGVNLNGDGSSFDMSGNAKITDNTAKGFGGGVSLTGGTGGKVSFTMSDNAQITGNKCLGSACGGAGLYATNGELTMNDNATISDNHSLQDRGYGGGVFVSIGATFTMNDNATISRNSAYIASTDNYRKNYGGGVLVLGGTFNMNGGSISDNMAENGAGVYVKDNSSNAGTFTMNGGTITNNKVIKGNGGGVYVLSGFEIANDAQVLNNSRQDTSGQVTPDNVYLTTDKTFQINGKLTGGVHSIGVSAADTPADGSPVTFATAATGYTLTEEDADCFTSDADGIYPVLANNKMQLSTTAPHRHCLCGKEHHDVGDHMTDSQMTFTKLWMDDDGKLKIGDKELTTTVTIDNGYFDQGQKVTCYELPAGNYYLGNSITLDYPIYIASHYATAPASKDVKLCLNGNTITANRDFSAIVCSSNLSKTTFTLTDCQQKAGTITHTAGKTGSGVLLYSSWTAPDGNGTRFNMYGGSITGNTTEERGGGVNIGVKGNGGIFNLYGGAISGNKANGAGGGVYMDGQNSTFTMYDGKITSNTAGKDGGGVSSANAKFIMNGGSITGNTAAMGGGVSVGCYSSTDFTMNGGEIKNNMASDNGGGVYMGGRLRSYTFTLNGTPDISGNTKDSAANNVYLSSDAVITVGNLDTNVKIPVTLEKMPTEGFYVKFAEAGTGLELNDNIARQFSIENDGSDKCDKRIIENDPDELWLYVTGDKLHEHAICGESCGHKPNHSKVLWTPLTYDTNTQQLMYGSLPVPSAVKETSAVDAQGNPTKAYYTTYKLPAGNYYLADTIEMKGGSVTYNGNTVTSKGGVLEIETDVNLCLNGKWLSTSAPHVGVIVIKEAGALTLSDCGTGGRISSSCNAFAGVQIANDTSQAGTFTMYDGAIMNTATGVLMGNNSIFNMYGGTIANNGTGVSVVSTSKLTVGGSAKITGNDNENVFLNDKAMITIDSNLKNDARIGVTTEKSPIDKKPIQIATGATGWVLYTEIFKPDKADQGYVVTEDEQGKKLYLNVHIHNWLYGRSADGQTIIANCNVTGCPKPDGGRVTIDKPKHEVYGDGKSAEATLKAFNWQPDAVTVSNIKYEQPGKILSGAPTDAGTYWASITIGDATAGVQYTINSKKVTDPTIEVADAGTYDGTEKKPSVVVKDGEKVIPDSEYSVSYAGNINAGTATVTITDVAGGNYDVSGSMTFTINKGAYNGTVEKKVTIIKKRSTAQTGTLTAADFFPEGAVPKGAVISNVNDGFNSDVMNQLTLDQDTGKISYITAANITSTTDQTCKVTISSANYQDIEATLIFHPTDKTTVTIEGLTYTNKTYDGGAIQPTGTLLVTGGNVPANELEVLYEGTGNTTYNGPAAPKDAGTYKAIYKVADSNETYTGSVEYAFTISPKAVTTDMIGTIASQEYTGEVITPTPEVKDGSIKLTSGRDFDFSYDENTNADKNTAILIITGKGNYTGTARKTFTISPKDITGAVIELEQSELPYNGSIQTVKIQSVTVSGRTLTSGDYSIINGSDMFMSAKDSIPLMIEGKGNYTGTATTTWKIAKVDPGLDNFVVTPDFSTAQTYDGTPKAVTVQTKDVIGMGAVKVYYEGSYGTTYTRSETAPTNAGNYKVILAVAEGTNYRAKEIQAGTLNIDKADLTVEDITEFFEYTKTGAQTINIANLVPGARSYALGTATGDIGVLSEAITIDATGLIEFALSKLTTANIDNKVIVPVTITSENYNDVSANVNIYISPEYRIIEGAGSTWTQNTNGTVVIRGDGEFNRFHAVKVDGKVIDPANYEAKEGSTIITLKAEYLKTLSTGSHTFAIVWNNGIAGTNFTVAANTSGNNSGNNSNNNDSNHGSDNSGSNDSGNTAGAAANTAAASAQELDKVPATGDPFGIWLTLFAISLTGLAGMLARRKKN